MASAVDNWTDYYEASVIMTELTNTINSNI